MEWDTAAADAIVRESGKMTYQFESKKPILYNKENPTGVEPSKGCRP
jgi:3'(2'), 5'-bisphosphate nucleotidase